MRARSAPRQAASEPVAEKWPAIDAIDEVARLGEFGAAATFEQDLGEPDLLQTGSAAGISRQEADRGTEVLLSCVETVRLLLVGSEKAERAHLLEPIGARVGDDVFEQLTAGCLLHRIGSPQ